MATDRDVVISLCEKLGLTRREAADLDGETPCPPGQPDEQEYVVREGGVGCRADGLSRVVLGAGDGYTGFNVGFDFNSEGQLVQHDVYE